MWVLSLPLAKDLFLQGHPLLKRLFPNPGEQPFLLGGYCRIYCACIQKILTTVFFYNRKKHKNPIEFKKLDELKPYSIVGVLGYFYTENIQKGAL